MQFEQRIIGGFDAGWRGFRAILGFSHRVLGVGEGPGECLRIRPARLSMRGNLRRMDTVVGGDLLSYGLQLADFVAVRGNGGFPLRAAVDVAGAGNEGLQRFDAVSFGGGRERGNPGGLPGFNPCLPQCPSEALAANVGKLDRGEIVGLAEDGPGPAHCIGLNWLFHLGYTNFNYGFTL
jgi:hypothetical protein